MDNTTSQPAAPRPAAWTKYVGYTFILAGGAAGILRFWADIPPVSGLGLWDCGLYTLARSGWLLALLTGGWLLGLAKQSRDCLEPMEVFFLIMATLLSVLFTSSDYFPLASVPSRQAQQISSALARAGLLHSGASLVASPKDKATPALKAGQLAISDLLVRVECSSSGHCLVRYNREYLLSHYATWSQVADVIEGEAARLTAKRNDSDAIR